SFSRSHETDAGPFTNVEDVPVGGTSYISPPRSAQAPPAGQPSSETELKDHKHLFKDVVGNPSVSTAGPPGTTVVPPGTFNFPPGALTIPAGSPSVPADVPSGVAPAGASSKGKSPMVEEDIPITARTLKQMEEDRLGEEAAKAQVEAIASFSKTLLGDHVSEDNFPARMLMERMLMHKLEIDSDVVGNNMTTAEQLIQKSLCRKHIPKPKSTLLELDLDADAQTFIKVVVNEDSDDEVSPVWSVVVGWEVLPTPLCDINALYCIDGSTKHFTTLCQILHMMDRQDLVKLYDLVVQYYENHPITGAGLIL
nr:hypothetical protein [Tanacetum cinerariifolium]